MSSGRSQRPVGKGEKGRPVAQNRKAFHDFHIIDRFEAGLVLVGSEVKSLRDGKANLKDSYVLLERGEAWVVGIHISAYQPASYDNHDPERKRKLLLGRRELDKLMMRVQNKGVTLVPLALYFRGPWAKIEVGVARGKKAHDKRQAIKERELDREARAAVKARGKE